MLCIGIACVDLLIKGVDLATGFTHESKHADTIGMTVGGDAANEAIVLSRLGHATELICGLGVDGAGAFIENTVRAAGVGTENIIKSDKSGSPINVIVIHKDGQRNFINSGVPKAAHCFPDPKKAEGVKVVSLASLFLPPFTAVGICLETAKSAKEMGAIVCADVVVQPDSRLETIAPVLPYIDYFFPNKEEAVALTGKQALADIADVFLDLGIKNVVIKIGADGCYIKNHEMELTVPTYPQIQPVDTTGAGDNFAAGFISGLLQGMDCAACARYACGVATVSILSFGASTGVKSRQQVEACIREFEREAKQQ